MPAPRDRLLHFLAEMLVQPCRMDYCLAMMSGPCPRTLPTAATPISGQGCSRSLPMRTSNRRRENQQSRAQMRNRQTLVRLGLFWANRIAEAKD